MKIQKYEKIKTELENEPRLFRLWDEVIGTKKEQNLEGDKNDK